MYPQNKEKNKNSQSYNENPNKYFENRPRRRRPILNAELAEVSHLIVIISR